MKIQTTEPTDLNQGENPGGCDLSGLIAEETHIREFAYDLPVWMAAIENFGVVYKRPSPFKIIASTRNNEGGQWHEIVHTGHFTDKCQTVFTDILRLGMEFQVAMNAADERRIKAHQFQNCVDSHFCDLENEFGI